MKALMLFIVFCSVSLAADDFLDERQGLLGVKLGAQQSQVFKILGSPASLSQPDSDATPVDGCKTHASWPLKGGTLDVCFDGANKVFFMALYTHESTTVGLVRLGADTLATIERFRNKVQRKSCALDEGYVTGAVTFQGQDSQAEIILSSTDGPYATEKRCPGTMVINRVALWMKAGAAK